MNECFEHIISQIDKSSIDSNISQIGKIYETSWIRVWNSEMRKRLNEVKRIAHQYKLHISYNMVYANIDDFDTLFKVQQIVRDEYNMFVSPVTWFPTSKFGLKKFGFGYFPYLKKFDFVYNSNSTVFSFNELYNKHFPVTENGFNEIESIRLNILKTRNECLMPIWLDNESFEPRFVSYKTNFWNWRYFEQDDSIYSKELSPSEYAEKVLSDNELIDDYIKDYKLIITDKYDKVESAYGMLKMRLNVSNYLEIWNSYKNFQMIAFSIDDSIIDQNSRHNEFFRWVNKEND